jgi:hypothetical protein
MSAAVRLPGSLDRMKKMKMLTDTAPEAERMVADIYRRMPPARKALQVSEAWQRARDLHAVGYRLRFPHASARAVFGDWLAVTLGPLSPKSIGTPMEETNDLWKIVFDLVHLFDRLNIRCALGGSMVSSIFGKPRYTQDADLCAEPFTGKEAAFIQGLDAGYYVSLAAVEQAVRERGSFNVIHTASGFKIDVFVKKDTPFEQSAFARRRLVELGEEPIYLVSPEDIILFKLEWHRLGGGVSDRQWSDIVGVLQVQKDHLDFAYMEQWAAQLGLADALRKACEDAE